MPLKPRKVKKKNNAKQQVDDAEPEFKSAKQSGYIFFSNHFRDEARSGITEDVPKADRNKMVMKRLGEMWSDLSEDQKRDWNERAPMVDKKVKRKVPKQAASAAPGPAQKPAKAGSHSVGELSEDQIQKLREYKSLLDDGTLNQAEFNRLKAQMLASPSPSLQPDPQQASYEDDAYGTMMGQPAAREPKAKKAKKSAAAAGGEGGSGSGGAAAPRLMLPVSAVEKYLDEDCECAANNPKRPDSESSNRYEKYKSGRTLRECLDLGAKKSDLANDCLKGFITLCDADKQEDLLSFAGPQSSRPERGDKKRKEADGDEAATGGDPDCQKQIFALEHLEGTYYVTRVTATAPPLKSGMPGPASYKKATGALVIKLDEDSVGAIMMKGVQNNFTETIFVPRILRPKAFTSEGAFKFKLVEKDLGGTKGTATGELEVQVTEFKDENQNPILQGNFKFDATLTEFDTTKSWAEHIRMFKADVENDDEWPDNPRLY